MLFERTRTVEILVGILVALLLPIFLSLPLMDAAVARLPPRLRLYVRWRSLRDLRGGPLLSGPMRDKTAEIRNEDFLEARAARLRRRTWIVAAPVILLGALSWSAALGVRAEAEVTSAGLQRRGFVHSDLVHWEDLNAVEVGCAHVCRQDVVRYDLRTEDGDVLSALSGCPSREQLEALARLDSLVRAADVPRARATHDEGEPFWDPGCTSRVANQTGVDVGALNRIVALE